MEYKEVFMIFATNIGNIYRNVFGTDMFSWKKLLMSVIFSTLLGTILVLFVQENHTQLWLALVVAVFLGIVSTNIGNLIMSLGKTSEQKISDIGVDLIDQKIRSVIGISKNNSLNKDNNGTDNN